MPSNEWPAGLGVSCRFALVNGGLPDKPLFVYVDCVQPANVPDSKPPLVKIAHAGDEASARIAKRLRPAFVMLPSCLVVGGGPRATLPSCSRRDNISDDIQYNQ